MNLAIFLFLYFCNGFVSSEVYYITTLTENSSCSENFCLTLSDFAANFNNPSHEANTTLIFQPGNHSLGSALIVKYGNNFSMVAHHSKVTHISCEWDANFRFFRTSNVYISGMVITHCENSHQVGRVNQFMLLNCIISYHEYTAIYFSYSNVNIMNTSFISNWGGSSHRISNILTYYHVEVGGAIIFSACNATLSYCIFMDNRAQTGAAIFSTWESKVTITTSIFVENQVDGPFSYGGALYFEDDCTVILLNSTFQDNSASSFGGAVDIVSQSSLYTQFCNYSYNIANTGGVIAAHEANKVMIKNSSFVGNAANDSGGVLFAFQVNHMNIIGSKFESNGANNIAGVIETFLSPIEISGSEFINNTATKYGGVFVIVFAYIIVDSTELLRNSAKYAGVMYINAQLHSEFSNCEFSHNSASIRGGVINTHNADIKFMDSTFASNHAFSGAVLYIQTNSEVEVENVVIKNNMAKQGILYCIESTTIFLNNVHVLDNCGSFFSHYSKVLFRGNITFINNEPTRYTGTTSIFQEGGAITAFQSELDLMGNNSFKSNAATKGGAICLIASKIYMNGNTLVVNNSATDSGGGIYLHQSEMSCKKHSTLKLVGNSAAERGGGIHATSSIITLMYDVGTKQLYTGSNLKFIENTAEKMGGGMSLEVNTKVNILNVSKYDSSDAQYTFEFITNSADYGGAVYVADDTNSATCMSTSYMAYSSSTECFFQTLVTIVRQQTNLASQIVANPINTLFTGNIAHTKGSSVYGGLLDRCSVSPFVQRTNNEIEREKSVNGVTYFKSISNNTDLDPYAISSKPIKVCFCQDNAPNCNATKSPLVTTKKGHNFTVTLVAVDQVQNVVSATILSSPRSNESGMGEGQHIQNTGENCTDLIYSIFSPNDNEELVVYADGPCKDAPLSQGLIRIQFQPCTCSIGFQHNLEERTKCVCKCDSKLSEYITDCNPQDQTLTRTKNFWLTNVSAFSNSYLIFPNCPLNYCHPPSSNIKINLNILNGADAQCTNDRSGILCGTCKSGLSLSLGSSRCILCPSYWPGTLVIILLAALLAGIALVFFLLCLNLTVAVGTINGIIFYAHIANANSGTFLPFSKPNFITVFLAWLNLELGFDGCLFQGMDTFWKTLLHLSYPVYLFSLVAAIIIISERSTKFARFIGKKNPVATLATVILLSYSKLLHLTIASLSFAILNYPDGFRKVAWLHDASVLYIRGKHAILFLVALFILIVGSIYTAVLFFWQWLLRHQSRKPLKWVQNQRLYMFLEPYHAPYTFKHRYWTGLLLFIRAILYIISAANVSNDPAVNLLAVGITMTCLLLLKGYSQGNLYQKWSLDVLEMACYLNIALFSLVELFILEGNRNQEIIAYISGSFTIVLFLLVLVYHLFTEVLSKANVSKLLRQKQEGPEELRIDLLVTDVNQRPLVEPTYSEVAGPARERPSPDHATAKTITLTDEDKQISNNF